MTEANDNTLLKQNLNRLIVYFETLDRRTLKQLADYYAADAYFKDPFNEVSGPQAIERIFSHMFEQLEAPRFIITGRYLSDDNSISEAMLRWELRFKSRSMGPAEQSIVGSTWLCFDAKGLVTLHRDYWDASEELFSKLPLIGPLSRLLRRQLAA